MNSEIQTTIDRIDALILKHLPGKHDQKTHGRGSGSQLEEAKSIASFDNYDDMFEIFKSNSKLERYFDKKFTYEEIKNNQVVVDVLERAFGVSIEEIKHHVDSNAISSIIRKVQTQESLYQSLKNNKDFLKYALGKVWDKADYSNREGDIKFAIRNLIDSWAETSGDHDSFACRIQNCVKKIFKAGNTEHLVQVSDDYPEDKISNKGITAFVKAQYDNTQKLLKEKGIKNLVLFRGVKGQNHSYQSSDDYEIDMQPASSFSTSFNSAVRFTRNKGAIFTVVVPASRILGLPGKGFGCLNENEVVVLAGKTKSHSLAAKDPKYSGEFDYLSNQIYDYKKAVEGNYGRHVSWAEAFYDKVIMPNKLSKINKGLKQQEAVPNIDANIEDSDWPKRTRDELLNDVFKKEEIIQKKSINSEVKFDVAKWDKILQRRMAELIQEVVKLNGESSIESIQKTIQKSFSKATSKAIPEYIDPLIGTEGNVRMRFDVFDPNVTQFVNDRSFRFSFDVNEYTQRELKNQLNRGFEEGESIKTIKERVKMVFGFGDNKEGNYRAQRIARSEVIRASNYGQEQAYVQSGVVSGKEWLTSFDERTCPACGAMDGRIIGLNQNYFNRGDIFQGFNLNYEDIKGPPLHPQCRCTLVPIVKEEYLTDEPYFVREEKIEVGTPFARGNIIEEKALVTNTLNECHLVEIDGDGKGIYKNERQEKIKQKRYYMATSNMMNLEDCSMVQREVLASGIDKILGLNLVPETVLKKGLRLKTIGSTQQFIEGYTNLGNESNLNRNVAWNALSLEEQQAKIIQMSVFDDLIANIDRHAGNIGFGNDGELKLIDNGASFAHSPQKAWNGRFLNCAGQSFVDKYFPEEANKEFLALEIRRNEMYVETAKSVGNKLYVNKEVIDNLFDNAGLTTREIDAFWERAAAMKAGKFVELEERILESFGYLRR